MRGRQYANCFWTIANYMNTCAVGFTFVDPVAARHSSFFDSLSWPPAPPGYPLIACTPALCVPIRHTL